MIHNHHNLKPSAARSRPARSLAIAAAILFGQIAGSAGASTIVPVTFPERVAQAELIVDAVVVAINHRNSDVLETGDMEIPHTFVTFAVDRVIKGTFEGEGTITLRFLGGPDGKGTTTLVAGLPRFRLGDREVLFVAKNGKYLCPLVGWGQGRLRIIRGAVFDDAGFQVWITPDGHIARGESRVDVREGSYPSLMSPESADEARPRFAPPEGSVLPDHDGIVAVLREMAKLAEVAGETQPLPAVKNADIASPFRAPAFTRAKKVSAPTAEVGEVQTDRRGS